MVNNSQRLYNRDVAILKQYGKRYKLQLHRSLRNSGLEVKEKRRIKGEYVHEEKLEASIIRTRSKIYELAICNDWDFFVTLTLDKRKYDRMDLKRYRVNLAQFIRDYNKKYKINIKYLLIPEMHKDKAWHMHGFIMGLPLEHLKKNENGYLDWFAYRNKFGYISIDEIRNKEAASCYILKYITKNLENCVKELNDHMYYCSQGLKRAEVIKRGMLKERNVKWEFENEWVKIKWLKENENIEDFIY